MAPLTLFRRAAEIGLHLSRSFVLALVFFSPASNLHAEEVVQLTRNMQKVPLGSSVQYLEDPTGDITMDAILAGSFDRDFIPSKSQSLNFGFTSSTYWFRVNLINQNPAVTDWVLEVSYPMLDYVDVYVVYLNSDKEMVTRGGGDLVPFSKRELKQPYMLYKVPLAHRDIATLLIRVQTGSSMQVPLVLWTSHALLQGQHREALVMGAYFGILMAMLIFNLMIYLAIRDINYFYYVCFLSTSLLFYASLRGYAFQYLWPETPGWGNISTPFSLAIFSMTIIQFSREFLQLRTNLPRFELVFRGLLVVFGGVVLASLFLDYSFAIQSGTLLTLVLTPLVFAAGVLCLRKGVLHARFFMLAWSVLLCFMFIYTLKTFGVLPQTFITENGMLIGAALEAILLSFALAHRMRVLREENDRIQKGITEMLERRVAERTCELDKALSNVAEANKKLTALSHTDGLTGLGNRIYLNEVMDSEWRRLQRSGAPFSVLMLDIDHFKNVNDTYGHLCGDVCLKQVARTAQGLLQRPADGAFRYGGEEFVILLPATDERGALCIGERIRQAVSNLVVDCDGLQITFTISIGVACLIPDSNASPEDLIHKADVALYDAKHGGRNRVCAFNLKQEGCASHENKAVAAEDKLAADG